MISYSDLLLSWASTTLKGSDINVSAAPLQQSMHCTMPWYVLCVVLQCFVLWFPLCALQAGSSAALLMGIASVAPVSGVRHCHVTAQHVLCGATQLFCVLCILVCALWFAEHLDDVSNSLWFYLRLRCHCWRCGRPWLQMAECARTSTRSRP